MKEQLYTIPVTDAFESNCECPLCKMKKELEQNAIEYTLGPSYMEDDNRAMTDELGFCEQHIQRLYLEKKKWLCILTELLAVAAVLLIVFSGTRYNDLYHTCVAKAYEILNCVPGVHMALPESGFLGWIDVSELGNSTEIAQYLVTHARVSLNDGVNYGPGGAGHLRIVLGVYKDDQKVIDALERIRDALLAYPRK